MPVITTSPFVDSDISAKTHCTNKRTEKRGQGAPNSLFSWAEILSIVILRWAIPADFFHVVVKVMIEVQILSIVESRSSTFRSKPITSEGDLPVFLLTTRLKTPA